MAYFYSKIMEMLSLVHQTDFFRIAHHSALAALS